MRLLSWNVNGLRACDKRGFRRWLDRSAAFAVCVQEVRARREDLPRRLAAPRAWHTELVPAERRGYSGVGLYCQRPPDQVWRALGDPALDGEGRLVAARFGRLVVASCYFPNGNGKDRDNSRVPFKLAYYRAVHAHLGALRASGLRVVVMGDFNTAHQDLDLARPGQNRKTSGFLAEERSELDRWLADGWADSFRCFETGAGHYTWWKQAFGARERNIGWRIDYGLVCPEARRFLSGAFIQPAVRGSDHCPIGLDLDDRVLD